MTAPGWAPYPAAARGREEIRARLGIDPGALVVGIVGSLVWNPRVEYCYGAELVHALVRLERPDVHVLIVDDGDGRAHLGGNAQATETGRRITFAGRVERIRCRHIWPRWTSRACRRAWTGWDRSVTRPS